MTDFINNTHVLYISYDGMTDPLGQSQVLPYVIGLSQKGYRFTILSFEKDIAFKKNKSNIQALCDEHKIAWIPLKYTKKPPVLSTLWDIMQMRRKAKWLYKTQPFSIVHCRSYIASLAGLELKRMYGVKFIFDMRGFWADERVDGRLWNLSNPVMNAVYRFFKKKERQFLGESDAVVSLTKAAKTDMESWPGLHIVNGKINVIPCATDYNLFAVQTEQTKQNARKILGLPQDVFLLTYVGSLGTWYMLPEMLSFFSMLKSNIANARFLILTKDKDVVNDDMINDLHIEREDLIIRFAERSQIPIIAPASDYSIFFIRPTYSKISSCPTKLGELLAMGIPIVCNDKIGDVRDIVSITGAGFCINDFSKDSFQEVISSLLGSKRPEPKSIREASLPIFDLARGVESYEKIYSSL